ncbi:DUF6173 family protein [Paracoccus pacificus]|uniref:DUF6173 family protein n=1 Tax=Paracoccus pacificus TaxID=1463598 RepID=A0ABW4R2H9_9RHOB
MTKNPKMKSESAPKPAAAKPVKEKPVNEKPVNEKPGKGKAASVGKTATPKAPREAPVPVQPPSKPEPVMIPLPAIAADLWPTDGAADQATLHAAEQVFNHLLGRVKEFQEKLPENYELGIQLANFGGEKALHVRGMGFRNPNIIEFYGLLDGEKQVAVVQHVSQLNFLLIAVPPATEDAPYRIGFGARLSDPPAEK